MSTTAPLSIEARRAILQAEISRYVRQGYRVVSQTDTTAQLVKPKRFHLLLAILLGLLILLPLVLYVMWYIAQRDKQLYLEVDATGKVNRTWS